MGRIMAIDYGGKRTGIAVTDPMKIIAQPLTTVETNKLLDFLSDYFSNEDVDEVVIGYPMHLDGTDADIVTEIRDFAGKLVEKFNIKIEFFDERYTSKRAVQTLVEGGFKKKDRRKKENIDKIAAAIILQDYLQTLN